jgi:hypothetical protein
MTQPVSDDGCQNRAETRLVSVKASSAHGSPWPVSHVIYDERLGGLLRHYRRAA